MSQKHRKLTISLNLYRSDNHQTAATMTQAEALENKSSNVNGFTEASSTEDMFDHTYKEKEGHKPPMVIVWRNVFLMTLLHIGAVYSLFLIPTASHLTLLWCK